ncbi:MAG TPA: hypothetical protein VH640_06655, partial [Bryobacteraceae bacterium]
SQPRPPAPARLGALSLSDWISFSVSVREGEVDLPARCIVENQDRALRPILQKAGNFFGTAGGNLPKAFKCRVPHGLNIPG